MALCHLAPMLPSWAAKGDFLWSSYGAIPIVEYLLNNAQHYLCVNTALLGLWEDHFSICGNLPFRT